MGGWSQKRESQVHQGTICVFQSISCVCHSGLGDVGMLEDVAGMVLARCVAKKQLDSLSRLPSLWFHSLLVLAVYYQVKTTNLEITPLRQREWWNLSTKMKYIACKKQNQPSNFGDLAGKKLAGKEHLWCFEHFTNQVMQAF